MDLGGVNLSTSFLETGILTNQAQNLYYVNNNITKVSEFTNICVINRLFTGTPVLNPALHALQTGGNVRITVNAGGAEGFAYVSPNFVQRLSGFDALCNSPSILLATRNGSRLEARLNGVSFSANFTSSEIFGTRDFQFNFGTNRYNQFYSGNLHEFVQYQRALSSNEIFKLEGYVAWKWNIQTSLISSHPFRYTPPY